MTCTEASAALPLLIYGEPGPKDAALREHLAHCAACRRERQALDGVRRLLDDASAPGVEVDLPRLYQTLTDQQARRLRRWRGVALVLGALAAVLLLVFGLRLHMRLDANQVSVCWGDPPSTPAFIAPQPPMTQATLPPETEAQLRVLSELIHALKQDVEDRDERLAERLDRLQKHVLALQSQGDLRWSATEQDVAALYLLSRKGEKP